MCSCTGTMKYEKNTCRFGIRSQQNPADFGFESDKLEDLQGLRSGGFGDNPSSARTVIKKDREGETKLKRTVLKLGLRYSWAVVLHKDMGFKFHMKRTITRFTIDM